MLDIKFIRENVDVLQESIDARQLKLSIEELLTIDDARKIACREMENINAEANKIAKAVSKANAQERPDILAIGVGLKKQHTDLKARIKTIEASFNKLIMQVPNIMAPDTPIGKDDAENVVIRKFGFAKQFSTPPKDHVELGLSLDIVDFESGTKVAGNKFYFLKGAGADLEMALQSFAIAKAKAAGFTFLRTPDMARSSILQGSGFSPRGKNSNIYKVEGDDLNLIATSEITIGGMLSDRIYARDKLPERYVGLSHCFRMEAGAAGQSSKGLYRVHQFSKVELYILSDPENSENHLQEILALEESIYRDLGIPHQIVRICSGDLGNPAYKKFDIEAWMPGKGVNGEYGEITSAGNFTDFQSRRLNIKYEDKNSTVGYPHTLNGTAVATTRVILAILENFQTGEGGVIIPEVLRPYMGISEIVPKKHDVSFKSIKPKKIDF